MDAVTNPEIVRYGLGVLFGVSQSLILVVISAAFKTWLDVRKLNREMNAAFKKIRQLEGDAVGRRDQEARQAPVEVKDDDGQRSCSRGELCLSPSNGLDSGQP